LGPALSIKELEEQKKQDKEKQQKYVSIKIYINNFVSDVEDPKNVVK
jgi:hypothetical protein